MPNHPRVRTSSQTLRVLAFGLLAAGPARATWIEGKVFCDDGDSNFSAGDTRVDGVVVKAVSQTASPGTTLTDTTGDAVPVSPAVPGYYRILLPQVDDTYVVTIQSGLPPGSAVLMPASGQYSVFIDSGTGDPSTARKTRNFLLHDCVTSTTTTTLNGSGGSTSTTTPNGSGSSTSTTTPNGSGGSTSTTTPGGSGGSTSTTTPGGSGGSTSTTTPGGSGGSTSTTTPTTSGSSTTIGGPGGSPVPPNCGDGTLDLDEECDDGNRVAGDGCDAACATEDTSETWEINLRVREKSGERLYYFTLLPGLPPALVGSAPVHLTLSSRGFQMLDAELPASAFRVKPRPVLAQPDARYARAVGRFGIWRIKMTLIPVTGLRAYNAVLRVRGEMLRTVFARLHLTAVIRVGNVVYTATDPIKANRTGKFLRYIHPVLEH